VKCHISAARAVRRTAVMNKTCSGSFLGIVFLGLSSISVETNARSLVINLLQQEVPNLLNIPTQQACLLGGTVKQNKRKYLILLFSGIL